MIRSVGVRIIAKIMKANVDVPGTHKSVGSCGSIAMAWRCGGVDGSSTTYFKYEYVMC